MTILNQNELHDLAKLARLELQDDQVKSLTGDLAKILNYVEQIQHADTEGVEPFINASNELENVFGNDEVKGGVDNIQALQNAPESEDGFFKVPQVV